ncbi:DUF58 domain-containing protein [uncultured Paracoccus sp.]|uniref:DUF58 domain-containing protein n=1 Tax=uncultured Paracoccus sp. TaxID=189685 RepID=UPI00260F89D6|nr:DUF58 domain-containing protein [uncultured Paracoccus sp.]
MSVAVSREPGAARLRAEAEAAAAAVPELLLSAERLAAALQPGVHGLRRPGVGEDFWQYRPAAPGDTMRQIDWRRSARSDATFVRERESETAQTAMIWVSASRGMAWRGDPSRPTKRARAELLALALALVLLRGGEKVGLAGHTPQPGRAQADRIAQLLVSQGQGTGDDDLPPVADLRPFRRQVLIGDFLDDPAPLRDYLARAAAQGITGSLLQVLDPVEEGFPFAGAVRFRSAAGVLAHETRNAAALRDAYLARLADRRAALAEVAATAGWQFGTHDTGNAATGALLWLHGTLGNRAPGRVTTGGVSPQDRPERRDPNAPIRPVARNTAEA